MQTRGREDKLANDVFYTCGLIEYMARTTHNTGADVCDALGQDVLRRIVEYADVLHCENVAAVCDRLVEEAGITEGTCDTISQAHYGVPTHWDMGKVYKRLALGIMRESGCDPVSAVSEAFHSPIAPLLRDYNGSFFYEAPANILTAHLTGIIE